MNIISLQQDGKNYRADVTQALDISIPINFDAAQLQVFAAPAAQSEVYAAAGFVGDVAQGGSCNCRRYHLTPHCNGTHTESVGHLTRDAIAVNALVKSGLMLAQLISVDMRADKIAGAIGKDHLQASLQSSLSLHSFSALIVRTLPNSSDKLTRNYDAGIAPAYFAPDALTWLGECGIEHLLVDLPSVDAMNDPQLLAHRAFWGLPVGSTAASQARRAQATITELIYVPEHIVDATYLLSLQLAPFVADAAPSRPLLYPLLNNSLKESNE